MNIKTKEYGKLSAQQLKELYAHSHKFKQKQKELDQLAKERAEQFTKIFELTPPWSSWYDLPWIKSLAFFLYITGLDIIIAKAVKSTDPQQAVIELLDNADEYDLDIDTLSEEEACVFFSLYFSFVGQLSSISMFDRPMSVLVEQAKNGDDEALFSAVLVDRAVLSSTRITKRIQKANFYNDNSFFDSLAKSITRTRPRRPDKELDDVRFILEALDESVGLDKITEENLYNLIVEDLELYPTENKKDPFGSFKKLVQRRKNFKGT